MSNFPSLTFQQYPEQPLTVGAGNQKLSGVGSAKLPLSSSDGGLSTGGPLIISSSADSTTFTRVQTFSYGVIEEVYLWCSNPTGGNVNLTMSVESPSSSPSFTAASNIVVSITSQVGLVLVYPGITHTGDADGTRSLFMRSAAQNSLNISGFVVRSYPFPGKETETYGYFNSSAGE